ncbi:hypothetical protein T06_1105 [Trichinella sp. T6]|nr:hypothetical protein T06_1105 [Trichinella sp. T6]
MQPSFVKVLPYCMDYPLPAVHIVYNWREIVHRRCRAGVWHGVPLQSPALLDSPAIGLHAPLVP